MLAKDLYTDAVTLAEKAYGTHTSAFFPNIIGLTAALRSLTGDQSGADDLLNKLLPGAAYGAPRGLAMFYIVRGEFEEAKPWLDKAIEQRDPTIIPLMRGEFTTRFRTSPQWRDLARTVNVPA